MGRAGVRHLPAVEGLATTALEELLRSGSATARVAAAKFALERIPSASGELVRRAIYAEQQAKLAQELPTARAKLARLVESRATVLADNMYEERKRLDLEGSYEDTRIVSR